jgi:TetR/AcrR family transcriptional regulator, transcriptional repressor for nem operon
MRYPDGHKDNVRASIVASAAQALRRDGLAGVSIPALMKKAGLTHGGFYVHFKNRDELVAEAVLAAAEQTAQNVLSKEGGGLDAYLSELHVKHPEHGCVLAALGSEGRTQPPPVRRAFAKAARGFVELVGQTLDKKGSKPRSADEGLALAARMIGAVVLARLVDDDKLAKRILAAAKGA